MNASLFANIVQRKAAHISEPISLQKDGLLVEDNRGLSEENAGKWQGSRFLQNDSFFEDQGPSMQARLIFRIG
jgi:hypothetical protein